MMQQSMILTIPYDTLRTKHHLEYPIKETMKTNVIPKPIIHLNGFARDIDYTNDQTNKLKKYCVARISNLLKDGGSLIWNGEPFKHDSFTKLIMNISKQIQDKNPGYVSAYNSHKLKWVFVTFKRANYDIEKCRNRWNGILSKHTPLLIQRVPNSWRNFLKLNKQSIKWSKSDTVIVFGGGKFCKQLYESIKKDIKHNVRFYVYNVKCYNSKSNQYQHSSLSMVQDLSVTLIYV